MKYVIRRVAGGEGYGCSRWDEYWDAAQKEWRTSVRYMFESEKKAKTCCRYVGGEVVEVEE